MSLRSTCAQSTIEDFESRLTNNDYQIWTFDTTMQHMSTEDCEKGLSYTFSIHKKVGIKKQCIGGKWVVSNFKWEVENLKTDEYQIRVEFENKLIFFFVIDFPVLNNEMVLRLRTRSTDFKLTTEDIFYEDNDR